MGWVVKAAPRLLYHQKRHTVPSVKEVGWASESVWMGADKLHLHTVQLCVKSDDTKGCGDTICPPEDEQRAARNILRIVV